MTSEPVYLTLTEIVYLKALVNAHRGKMVAKNSGDLIGTKLPDTITDKLCEASYQLQNRGGYR